MTGRLLLSNGIESNSDPASRCTATSILSTRRPKKTMTTRVWRRILLEGHHTWKLVDEELAISQSLQLLSLPQEILLSIVAHLSVRDILTLKRVCKDFCNLVRNSPGLWRDQITRLQHSSVPVGLPTFKPFHALTVPELILATTHADSLRRTWKSSHPHPRACSTTISPRSTTSSHGQGISVMKLVRTGDRQWLILALDRGEVQVLDIRNATKPVATWKEFGRIHDLIVDAISQTEIIVVVSASIHPSGEVPRYQADLFQHDICVLKLTVPLIGHSGARFDEQYIAPSQYAVSDLVFQGDVIAGFAWKEGPWPNFIALVNWKAETGGLIELENPDRKLSLNLHGDRLFLYDESIDILRIRYCAIPNLLSFGENELPTMTDVQWSGIPLEIEGPPTFSIFSNPSLADDGTTKLGILSVSFGDHERGPEIVYRMLDIGTLDHPHSSGTPHHPTNDETKPSIIPNPLQTLDLFNPSPRLLYYQTNISTTTTEFYDELPIYALGQSGKRGVWVEFESAEDSDEFDDDDNSDSEDSDSDDGGDTYYVVGFTAPSTGSSASVPESPLTSPISPIFSSSTSQQRFPSSDSSSQPTRKLYLPPSLQPASIISLAFDESAGILCIATYRGDVWVFDYT